MGFFKRNKKTTELKPVAAHNFIDSKEYFFRYLVYEMQQISNDNLNPTTAYYETFEALATPMLEVDGHPGALNELGQRYMFGLDGKKDIDKAVELFQRAISLGHPDAISNLSEIYRNEAFGKQDYAEYFRTLEMAAERGAWMAMFNLSCAYHKGSTAYNGYGPGIDKVKALEWEVAAANMTCDILNLFLENPCSKRFVPYMKRVHMVCVRATHNAATEMIEGDGVPVNKAEAKTLLDKVIPVLAKLEGEDPVVFLELLSKCKDN